MKDKILIQCRRQIRKPWNWILMVLLTLALLLYNSMVITRSDSGMYGVYYSGYESGEQVLAYLQDPQELYTPVLYTSKETLLSDVRSGVLDCGFLLQDSLEEVTSLSDLEASIEYVSSPSTLRGALLKEKVFSAVLRTVSAQILISCGEDPAVFRAAGDDVSTDLLAFYEEYLGSGDLIRIQYEILDEEQKTEDPAASETAAASSQNSAASLQAFASLLLFACALLLGRQRFQKESVSICLALRTKERHLWCLAQILVPLCLMAAAEGLILCLMLQSPTPLLNLLLQSVLCTLWSYAFSLCFQREETCLTCVIPVLLLSIVSCPALITASGLIPALRVIRWVFPVQYLI